MPFARHADNDVDQIINELRRYRAAYLLPSDRAEKRQLVALASDLLRKRASAYEFLDEKPRYDA